MQPRGVQLVEVRLRVSPRAAAPKKVHAMEDEIRDAAKYDRWAAPCDGAYPVLSSSSHPRFRIRAWTDY
jgi:hypothetical protein